jgi:heat shock protein HspQ
MRSRIPTSTLQAITADRMTEHYDHPSVEEMFERIKTESIEAFL